MKLAYCAAKSRWATRGRMAKDLERLGVRRGAVLFVHSSLASLGFVPGGGRSVIAALRDALGSDGTVVLPTHSWEQMSSGCRWFDVRTTPSCVGALTEEFRRQPGVVRSLHPTHSVAAIGRCAEWITRGHEDALTPCGAGTPYAKLIDVNAQILFVGVNLECNTLYHTHEAIAQVPYLLRSEAEEFTLVDTRGASFTRWIRRHRDGLRRRFKEHESLLIRRGALGPGMIAGARGLVAGAGEMTSIILGELQKDRAFLLDPTALALLAVDMPQPIATGATPASSLIAEP